jgi:competence protein ComEC
VPGAFLAAFVLGVCALQWQADLPNRAALLLAVLVGAAAIAGALRVSRPPPALLLLACAGALMMGFGFAGLRAQHRLADALPFAHEGRDVTVTGVVASLPVRLDRGVRFEFDVEAHGSDVAVPQRILLGWYEAGVPVQPGERWSFVVRLRRPHGALNPGGFDFEAWMLERGLRASGYVRTSPESPPRRLDTMVWAPRYVIERARAWLRDRLLQHVGNDRYGGVLVALVLGDQRAISDADWTLFNRTGISHLVSISGLHITMIAALVGGVAGALWRRTPGLLRRAPAQLAAICAGMVAALLYALLAGWGIPAQRTVLMLACVAAAWIARARVTPGVALLLAAGVVCLFDPWAVTSAGFWLSFGAVAAIVWVVHGRPTRSASAGLGSVLSTAVRVQLAVSLALIPATVVLFQQISLVSPLANAVAIPVVSGVVTPLALVGAAIVALPIPVQALAAPVLALADSVFSVLALLLQALSVPAWSTIAVPAPPMAFGVLAIAGVAWLLAPPGWPARGLGAVALLPLLVWPGERPAAGDLWVTALDVGQGSAVVLETRDQAWLYDAGPRYSADADAGERVVLPYLRRRGIEALDGMVVSHLDQDHSGGAAAVLRGIEVRQVISSIPRGHAALGGREAVDRCEAGNSIQADAMVLHVVHPPALDYERRAATNAMSCVMRVQAGSITVLLTGDIPADGEDALARREPALRAQLLMAPHHGSRSSSSPALLTAVAPSRVFAQSGYRNRYGHPHPEVVERYTTRGIELARTDHGGALQWRFAAGGGVEHTAARATAVRYWHNRPSTGQGRPPADDLDEGQADEAPREPLSGMP